MYGLFSVAGLTLMVSRLTGINSEMCTESKLPPFDESYNVRPVGRVANEIATNCGLSK